MSSLETDRLILRDFALSDWEAINAIVSDPLVTRYMHFAAWDEQRRRAWLARMVHEAHDPQRVAYSRAITLRSNGQLIGWFFIGDMQPETPETPGTRTCGYALDRR
ncbi:MAG TPA: GNAT family N-acetyltransferase, partial [Ktedonobacterales bacterium]|nr:GNAT family N-acetyltransferase [Ktedonobacterales bacterium]